MLILLPRLCTLVISPTGKNSGLSAGMSTPASMQLDGYPQTVHHKLSTICKHASKNTIELTSSVHDRIPDSINQASHVVIATDDAVTCLGQGQVVVLGQCYS